VAGNEYHFTGWSGDLLSTDNPATLTMDGNKVVQATFEINQYTLTIQTNGNGTVKVNDTDYTDVITVNSGTVMNLQAVAGNEYHFTGWSGDLDGGENPVSITMDGNKIITADFSIIESVPTSSLNVTILYPNPFENELNISHGTEVQRIVITNLAGQKVLDIQPEGLKTISTSELKKGLYLVSIKLVDGRSMTQKIVKK
ncbi:MAG: T9SS type A sorting domain-containing protein, partial [Bacteroidetes bacterium]